MAEEHTITCTEQAKNKKTKHKWIVKDEEHSRNLSVLLDIPFFKHYSKASSHKTITAVQDITF